MNSPIIMSCEVFICLSHTYNVPSSNLVKLPKDICSHHEKTQTNLIFICSAYKYMHICIVTILGSLSILLAIKKADLKF